MSFEIIRKEFDLYLNAFIELGDLSPFILSYVDLALIFKDELSQSELQALVNRKKQLSEIGVQEVNFDDIRKSIRIKVDKNIQGDKDETRRGLLDRMLFCAFLDSGEDDFFYLTEPIFEFSEKIEISPDQLIKILQKNFSGFEINEV